MPADFDISPVIEPPASTPPTQPVAPAPGAAPVLPTPPSKPIPPPITPVMPRSSNRLLKWLVLGAVGLVLVTIAMLFWGGSSFSDKDVVVTLDAPEQITSGDQVTYAVQYQNNTKVALTNLSFRLFYPDKAVVIKDGQSTTPQSEGFTVDRLEPGESGSRSFQAYLVGDKGTIETARLHLIFNAGNLQSSFEKDITAATTITALPVALTLVAPPTSVSGQPIQYILDVRNDSDEDMTDLKAVFTYPDGFSVQRMQPQPNQGNTVWRLDQLKSGQGTRITIDGVLTGSEREAKTVSVVLQRNVNGQYLDYVRTDATTIISSPLLSVVLTPNTSREYVSFAGDTLRYSIAYANRSQYTLSGVMLTVKLEGAMYDFAGLDASEGSFNDNTGTITYDSSGVPAFSNLRPNQTGTLIFTVPLKAGLTGSTGASTFFVKATARMSTTNLPSGLDGNEIFAQDSVVTKISSQPSFTESILYDNGAGSGPLPPKVGQTTTLTVRWQLSNPGSDVRNSVVTATLPPGVSWAANATSTLGSPPTFTQSSNKVTWNIGTLPYGTGNGTPRAQGQFQISFTPSSNQVGQSVPLVTGTTFIGTDSFTGQPVQLHLRDYTTDDIDGHSGQGQVAQ